MKGLRAAHLIDRLMHRLYDRRSKRLRHVADTETDNLLIRICRRVSVYLLADRAEKIASRQLLVIVINLIHMYSPSSH